MPCCCNAAEELSAKDREILLFCIYFCLCFGGIERKGIARRAWLEASAFLCNLFKEKNSHFISNIVNNCKKNSVKTCPQLFCSSSNSTQRQNKKHKYNKWRVGTPREK